MAALDAGLDRPLTLVSAPAGFGKTTLVSEWIHFRAAAAEPPLGSCWVSLDEGENDPVRFLRYLAAALHRIIPRASEMVLALSQASSPPPLAAMLGVLINDLAELPQANMLVLDDYQVIREQTIHEAMAFLLDHMPPRFHRNALVELGQADLRFRADEITTFLHGWLGLAVSPADVRTLRARTEGWITGLQLAALSMQKHPDVAGFLTAFGGSDRHVLDYLVEEVLDRQPRPVQEFLLRTSILDRFCGPLCDAVMELPDDGENGKGKSPKSLDILGQLERANLFLVPLDAERHWYCYHQLFGDMLRARLRQSRPELLGELHRQASSWLERAGLIPEAIDHALAAGDVQRRRF
jgi:LuxR family maltose regulon positive regulatory protein